MHFDEDLRVDTPMGLLRGIKHGTESYHVLFKRLCSYAGLHCVVIKGYEKYNHLIQLIYMNRISRYVINQLLYNYQI